jgi:hypothetical protein
MTEVIPWRQEKKLNDRIRIERKKKINKRVKNEIKKIDLIHLPFERGFHSS